MRDLVNNLKVTKAVATGTVTASGTGITIDTQGFQSIMFAVLISAVTTADASNYITFGFAEGDASDNSDMTAVTDTDRILNSAVINNTNQDELTLKIGLSLGTKRYVRLIWTETGTASADFSGIAILGHPAHAPVA